MSGFETWEMMPKSQDDTSLISDAIDQAISDHNDDVDAHLGTDQALQSHRAAEIIDHLAESVVNDKLAPLARRYVAIVDPTSVSDFDTIAGAVDHALAKGGGDIFIKRGKHYISSDLLINPTISISGEGIEETRVIITDATTAGINIVREIPHLPTSIGTVTSTSGSDILTFTTPLTGDTSVHIGRAIRHSDSGGHVPKRITEVISTTQVRVTPAVTTGGVLGGCSIGDGGELTTDSNELKLYGNLTVSDTNVTLGSQLLTNGIGTGFTVVDIIDDQTILLSDTYTDDTEFNGINFVYSGLERAQFTDFTLENQTSAYGIYCESAVYSGDLEETSIDVLRMSFVGGGTYVAVAGPRTTVRDSRFESNTSNSLELNSGGLVENCIFRSLASGARALLGGNGCRVVRCRFEIGSGSSHNWLSDTSAAMNLEGNTFIGLNNLTIQSYPDDATFRSAYIAGNVFNFSSTRRLTISGTNVVFMGNFIEGATSTILLNSSSTDCVVVGNHSAPGITNSGTGNQVSLNTT